VTQHLTPAQEWWTAEEISGAGLPDLPASKRGVNLLAERLSWVAQPHFARRREGKGGGWEYSWQLFPDRAKRKLLQMAAQAASAPVAPTVRQGRDEAWTWFEKLPGAVKAKAETRLQLIQQVEALERVQGRGRHMAVVDVARTNGVGARTLWSWISMIEGVRTDDRLPYLSPRNRAVERSRTKDCDPEFFALIKSDFLRLEAPPFTDCYRRVLRVAKAKNLDVLPERTMRRRLDAAVSEPTQVLARKGIDAVKRMYPAQVRDKTALVALEAVNADFHKFDVFVEWPRPAGVNEPPQIMRPQMVAFQDIYSGRILAWRLDQSANSTAVMLAAGDMIETWGIPKHVLLDNGREFAAKCITGGVATRYRFKVKEDDIPGLFTGLGCTIHWAMPYSGQSKPIERAFRDMCSSIAKDPRLAGAYTGNKVDAQPENYMSRAIPLAEFLAVLAEGIEEHNTRQGRRSEVAFGRSFAEVFAESYATAPISKATEAQRRLWLLGAEGLRADKHSGRVKFQGNEFWADWMHEIANERVIIRFDPADLWGGVHVFSADNAYLGHAPCLVKAGFFDMDEAREHARARSQWMKAEKTALAAHKTYSAHQLGLELNATGTTPTPSVEAKVVKPVFGRKGDALVPGRVQTAPVMSGDEIAAGQAAMIMDMTARLAGRGPAPEETETDRFKRALDLERDAVVSTAE
jgi:putative transposase